MNWSDERYVKLYVRKTATWITWPWEARAVFPCMLKEADGAGLIDVGTRDPVRTLSVMLGLPFEIVTVAVAAMSETGTIEATDAGFLISRYIEAQEATKTDSRRKQDQRERQRAQVRATTQASVTRGHAVSRGVPLQPSPPPAQPTTSPAQPSSTTSPAQPPPPAQPSVAGSPKKRDKARTKAQGELPNVVPAAPAKPPTLIERVYEYFREGRELKLTSPGEAGGLDLPSAPPDDAPNWPRSAATLQAWMELRAGLGADVQERYAKILIDAFLEDPYWAGATHRETKDPQPYPWNALLSEKVWRGIHERLEREDARDGVH